MGHHDVPVDVRHMAEDGQGEVFPAGDRHAHTRHAGHAEGQHQGRGVHTSPGNADLPRPWRPAGPKRRPARPPAPYTKDTLSKDSREIGDAESPGDKRVVSDFRRSGAIEVIAGQGDEAVLASNMANTIDSNRELQATCLPNVASVVRLADQARERGRPIIKGSKNENGS
jgi:hypothetical protein